MKYFPAILATFMLGYVLIVVLFFGQKLDQVIVGLVAGLIVLASAIAVYIFERHSKGETR